MVAALLAFLVVPRGSDAGPRVLTDHAFMAAANQRCAPAIRRLRPPDDTTSRAPTNADLADRVEVVAGALHDLASSLRSLPAAPADLPRISAWLDDWDRYTAVGRRFAAAVRAGDEHAQAVIGTEGDRYQRSADRFARGNGLGRCQFFIAPQGSRSDPFSGGM